MYEELKKIEEGRKWMAEAENRVNEFLEEKVKEDHEEKDKKERAEAELAKSMAGPLAQDKADSRADPSGTAPQGSTTQRDQPRNKRETPARARRAEEEPSELEESKERPASLGHHRWRWTTQLAWRRHHQVKDRVQYPTRGVL